jgi:hypothetical protein
MHNPTAFFCCNRTSSSAVALISAISYLNEYQAVPVLHDQVYFTASAIKVFMKQLQSALPEKVARQ